MPDQFDMLPIVALEYHFNLINILQVNKDLGLVKITDI